MVLRVCYELLQEAKQATQREIFYRLLSESPNYFQSQRQVNDSIQGFLLFILSIHTHCEDNTRFYLIRSSFGLEIVLLYVFNS